MKYLEFRINKYKAIDQELVVKLDKNRLVPIIGINECGKTTILHGIFAFDYFNDNFNNSIHHLDDVKNLYKPGQKNHASISAKIQMVDDEFLEILNKLKQKAIIGADQYKRKKNHFNGEIIITRDLVTKKYLIESVFFNNSELNQHLAEEVIRKLPYILFFDDFRDSFPDIVEIRKEENKKPSGWLAIIEKLFQKTNSDFSVFALNSIEERERNSIISQVQKKLNETLTREWQKFHLSDNESLKISISFTPQSTDSAGVTKDPYLKFDILETDKEGNDHYFYIRDRSKGFFWFFNFVLKLEFNPKVISNDGVDAVYLLDEPGSYLHASAQSKLCKKLKDLSKANYVVYCTHSHYLLDPEIIPINAIKIAEKDRYFNIKLNTIYDYKTKDIKRNAFQPLYDALQLKPFSLDITGKIIIVEGIYDFYCFKMFIEEDYQFIPSVDASSIKYYISLMLGWHLDFNALWDNDVEGNMNRQDTLKKFGEEFYDKLLLLPLKGSQKKAILQDFLDGSDLKLIKNELNIPTNSSFEKTMASLYYSENKQQILTQLTTTKDNFKEISRLFTF